MTVSEWADARRVLPPGSSSEHGPWRTSRTPYLREIMDCLSPSSDIEEVTVMKGAQLGLTEAGNNWIGYTIDVAPAPMLSVMPTIKAAEKNAKQKVNPLLWDNPHLRGKVSGTILEKVFPGGLLVMTGANSGVGLRSFSAGKLLLDEVDGYPIDVEEEGDPIELAKARLATFPRAKVLHISTPTLTETSRIARIFSKSDQRYFYLPCPRCEGFQSLTWEQMRWEGQDPRTAYYLCVHCGHHIRNHDKAWMLPRGEWRAHNPGAADGKHAGFHLSSLYSPVGWKGWEKIVAQWLDAEATRNASLSKTFYNTVLGLTYTVKGDIPDWKLLHARRGPHRTNRLAAGILFLTAGVDCQRDRIEVEIVGWDRYRRSYSIDYRVYPGTVAEGDVLHHLDELLNEQWVLPNGTSLRIRRMAVDTAYAGNTIYGWGRNKDKKRVMLIRGFDDQQRALGKMMFPDVNIDGQEIRRGVQVWKIGVSFIKSQIYGWLGLEPRKVAEETYEYPEGYCFFPGEYDEDYFQGLCSEQQVTKIVDGYDTLAWKKVRERNEPLDCRAYALAAALSLGLDRMQPHKWERLEQKVAPPAAPLATTDSPDDEELAAPVSTASPAPKSTRSKLAVSKRFRRNPMRF